MIETTLPLPSTDEPSTTQPKRRRTRGFTLIEIMAVVLIMGMLMGLVGVAVFSRVEEAAMTTAGVKISQLESALEFYRMDNFKYPPTLEGLVSKPPDAKRFPKGGYLKKADALMDPWDAKFNYVNPGVKNPHSVDISSAGPDGVAGNEDDVNNWDGNMPAEG
ncbi:MAG: type II secretion system major pseudopilin GspG [Myxococcota bacterium]|jgi:general secretion pathway protein G|nr:type II secretion system major pseudopilin GspG [Myxococcota bacterium]